MRCHRSPDRACPALHDSYARTLPTRRLDRTALAIACRRSYYGAIKSLGIVRVHAQRSNSIPPLDLGLRWH